MGYINLDIAEEQIGDGVRQMAMKLEVRRVGEESALSALIAAYLQVYEKYADEHFADCHDSRCQFDATYKPAYEALKAIRQRQASGAATVLGKQSENF